MTLRELMTTGGLFQGYAYGYPHKTAYRPLARPVALEEAWAAEDKQALFLYLHVPFCEMRCGFCNLFTTTGADQTLEDRYLTALEAEAVAARAAVGSRAVISRLAIGGGTPTVLSLSQLQRLFGVVQTFALSPPAMTSVEMSPQTADPEKLQWLRQAGVTRASLGVQSFAEAETRHLGRPQKPAHVEAALQAITAAGFPIRNIDLIYGMEGQTWESWHASLQAALRWQPEELFLYPLYVRPLTGLGRHGRTPADHRDELYRRGRDWLLERGYRQVSMRLFRSPAHPGTAAPLYCCQEDGMIGLGAGARSYTRGLHYSTEWAVGRSSVRAILEAYCQRTPGEWGCATYGAVLDDEEQRRRYLIKSILRAEGLDAAAYRLRFGTAVQEDFREIDELLAAGTAVWEAGWLKPTLLGLEWSDVIGPWLYSAAVRGAMGGFELT